VVAALNYLQIDNILTKIEEKIIESNYLLLLYWNYGNDILESNYLLFLYWNYGNDILPN
jgi:hypothetical protein